MPYALCTAIAPFWFPKDWLMPFCLSNDRDIFMITSDNCSIDLFTNVSQIYGCFFPRDLVTSHFINLYLTMVFQYLETTLLLYRTNLGQAFRLSGTTFVKMVCIKSVNPSIKQISSLTSTFFFPPQISSFLTASMLAVDVATPWPTWSRSAMLERYSITGATLGSPWPSWTSEGGSQGKNLPPSSLWRCVGNL